MEVLGAAGQEREAHTGKEATEVREVEQKDTVKGDPACRHIFDLNHATEHVKANRSRITSAHVLHMCLFSSPDRWEVGTADSRGGEAHPWFYHPVGPTLESSNENGLDIYKLNDSAVTVLSNGALLCS